MLNLNPINKLLDAPMSFTFDDFVLAPVHSTVRSRKDPDVSVTTPGARLQIPIISSPMNTVTEADMLVTMRLQGGIGVLHRYMSVEDQIAIVRDVRQRMASEGLLETIKHGFEGFIAVGANGDVKERVGALWDAGVHKFCIDVANGHSDHCIEAIRYIKDAYSDAIVMAGNVCTHDGALRLAEAGADLIRVGVGPGSMCKTRLVTGHGVPQLSAIVDCARIKVKGNGHSDNSLIPSEYANVTIVADGGIRSSGDIVKALAAGADVVMLGSLLAGTSDTPGDIHKDPDTSTLYKYYHGMASTEGRRSWFDRSKTAYVPEGESTRVPYKGDTTMVLEQLIGGVKTGMSYAGAHDLNQLRLNAQWVRVSPAGLIEGTPHGKR